MNSLANSPTPSATQLPNATLEELLNAMLQYGKPRVSYLSEGWYCSVEMNTNALGARFEIASNFKHESALSAARQCMERAQEAVKLYR